jgi:choline dehydrogenase-like flavoprotein
MSDSTIAIVGSGPSGAALAFALTQRGHQVVVFEKGPEYPYPYAKQFADQVQHLYSNPVYELPPDLKRVDQSGTYAGDINQDLFMNVGGAGARWAGVTLRMVPNDFKTRSRYGYGEDWPLTYDELEPYYCRAESHLGTAGTDEDNPFAPPRSRPYPLPPFELSYEDNRIAAKLKDHGIVLHSTPQARTRHAYDERNACVNFGTCWVCPIGARYSPSHHLQRAVQTGRCTVITNASVRRIVTDRARLARGLVYRINDERQDREYAARVIVIAAGAIESIRLLWLSAGGAHPNGIGNQGGQLGRNLMFHHAWHGWLRFDEPLHPMGFGGWTGQSQQLVDAPTRRRHGGIKLELPFKGGPGEFFRPTPEQWGNGKDALRDLRERQHQIVVRLHCEAFPGPEKHVALSRAKDRFGDPFALLHYELNNRDHEPYNAAKEFLDRVVRACGAEIMRFNSLDEYGSSAHHMGGCRMGTSPENSVTDGFGKVHGLSNLFLAGGSTFASVGSVNPTLTMVALALRTSDYIHERAL